MRTAVHLAIALAATASAVLAWQNPASAATAIEYGLIVALV